MTAPSSPHVPPPGTPPPSGPPTGPTHPAGPAEPGPVGPAGPGPTRNNGGGPWPSGPGPTGPSGPTGPGREDPDRLLTPAVVAALFGVHPMTLWKWAKRGRIACTRTVGGHRRYRESDVQALLEKATS